MVTEPYHFVRHNRTPRTVAILICIYAALLSLVILFEAKWWLMALFALATLPALRDVIADTRAGLSIADGELRWFTGKRSGQLALDEIDHLRFDTRWDLSVRVTAILNSGRKVRLPDEIRPPHREFEQVLADRGLKVARHHFTAF